MVPLLALQHSSDEGVTQTAGQPHSRALNREQVGLQHDFVTDWPSVAVGVTQPLGNGVERVAYRAVTELAAIGSKDIAVPAIGQTVIQRFRHAVHAEHAVIGDVGAGCLAVTVPVEFGVGIEAFGHGLDV